VANYEQEGTPLTLNEGNKTIELYKLLEVVLLSIGEQAVMS